ncbi:MAG: hypothetical protein NTV68_15515 [Methanomicrobiales archaeon]|nr:hypothetical protein [Methanomicrobiales archaeon]
MLLIFMYPKARFNEKFRPLKKRNGAEIRVGNLRILLESRGKVNGEFPGNPWAACTAPDLAWVVTGSPAESKRGSPGGTAGDVVPPVFPKPQSP